MDIETETMTMTTETSGDSSETETTTMAFGLEEEEEEDSIESVSPIDHIFFSEPQLIPEEEERRKQLLKEIEENNRDYIKKMNEYVEKYHFQIGKSRFLEQQENFLSSQLSRIKLWTSDSPSDSSKLRNYQIVEVLGRGGSSEVYKVKHRYLDIFRAAKLFKRNRNESDSENAIEEARKVIKMHSNKYIVKVFDLDFVTTETGGKSERRCVIIMELVDCSLRDYLIEIDRRKSRMSLKEFFKIISDLLEGLKYIHDNGIIHRDIKPSNIGLIMNQQTGRPCRAKILDFGISTRLGEKLTRFGGSTGYIAPEVLRNPKKVSFQSDIYSLGQLMKQMLFGYEIFDIPSGLVSIIHRCCEESLEKRYGDIFELEDDYSFCCYYEEISELSKIRTHLFRRKFSFTQFPNIWAKNYRGWKRENILIQYDDSKLELDRRVPNEYINIYNRNKNPKNSEQILIAVKRFGRDSSGNLRFVLRKTNFGHFWGMAQVFRSLEKTARIRNMREKNPLFMNKCLIHIALISEDSKLLFLEHQEDGQNINCGVVKDLEEEDTKNFEDSNQIFFHASVRALDRELLLFPNPNEMLQAMKYIRLTGLICCNRDMEVGIVGYLDLRTRRIGRRSLMSNEIESRSLKKKVKMKWVDFSVERVVTFLRMNKGKISESVLGCSVFTLKSLFGKERMGHIIMKSLTTTTKAETLKIKL